MADKPKTQKVVDDRRGFTDTRGAAAYTSMSKIRLEKARHYEIAHMGEQRGAEFLRHYHAIHLLREAESTIAAIAPELW